MFMFMGCLFLKLMRHILTESQEIHEMQNGK